MQSIFSTQMLSTGLDSLHLIYNDEQSCFEILLKKDLSVSIYNRNIQVLATEIYKSTSLSSVIYLHANIVIITICDIILSSSELLLELELQTKQ